MLEYKTRATQNRQPFAQIDIQNQNLICLAIFLVISVIAYINKDFNLFTSSPESIRQILGYPPPAYLINVALAVYCFSATILTLTAIANNAKPEQKWNHLGYRVTFYLLYCFSGAIDANFLPIVLVGLFLYSLDQCHIWIHHGKTIHHDGGLLGKS